MPLLGGRRRFVNQEAKGSPIDSLFRDDDNQPRRRDIRQMLRASVVRAQDLRSERVGRLECDSVSLNVPTPSHVVRAGERTPEQLPYFQGYEETARTLGATDVLELVSSKTL